MLFKCQRGEAGGLLALPDPPDLLAPPALVVFFAIGFPAGRGLVSWSGLPLFGGALEPLFLDFKKGFGIEQKSCFDLILSQQARSKY